MLSAERNYYLQRIKQESVAAAASSAQARQAHRELAERYADKLEPLEFDFHRDTALRPRDQSMLKRPHCRTDYRATGD